jgi:hypothetical protein
MGDKKSNPASPVSNGRAARPKASNYDMFEGLQQTRLKAAEANRKRLLGSSAPVTLPDPQE